MATKHFNLSQIKVYVFGLSVSNMISNSTSLKHSDTVSKTKASTATLSKQLSFHENLCKIVESVLLFIKDIILRNIVHCNITVLRTENG